MRCKRCGEPGHQSRTCKMPPIDRPNIERLRDRLRGATAGRVEKYMQRGHALAVFDELLAYIERLEAQRRALIVAVRQTQTGVS